jgi:hypothetical protein
MNILSHIFFPLFLFFQQIIPTSSTMGTTGKCNNCGSTDIASPSNDHEEGEPSGKYKICDEYDSDDADIDLISSDNYRFKVHSYRLQYSS